MSKQDWRIDYENDTGHDDGGFWEWWTVTDGAKSFKCDTEADANWLAALLRSQQPGQDEREAFVRWVCTEWRPDDGASLLKRDFPHFAFAAFKAGARLSAPQAAGQWLPIETAEEGVLYVVGYFDEEEIEDKHGFDWLEDGVWHRHSENHDHYLMVGGPKLGRGPSEKAPYTHLIKLAPLPPTPAGEGG